MKARIIDNGVGAKSVVFHCPGCRESHTVRVAGPSAWGWNGSLDAPTFTPSLLVRSGHYAPGHQGGDCWCTYNAENPAEPSPFRCQVCHSFIRDGRIEFLSDCTHELAGQTVEIPELPSFGSRGCGPGGCR